MSLGLFRANQFGFEELLGLPCPMVWGKGSSLMWGGGALGVGREKPGGRKWSREVLVWDMMELSLLKRRSQSDGTTLQNYHTIWFTDGGWTSPKRLPRGRGLWVVRRSGDGDAWPL